VVRSLSSVARLAGVALSLIAMLAGCASSPERASPRPAAIPRSAGQIALGDEIAVRAMAQIGTPYRYGGADLGGFDCSGLVHHVYRELGIAVPRTAAAQYEASRRLSQSELLPGDLVFFRTSGRRISHVGIYAGDGRFVHAPKTGRDVELRALDDEYYRSTYAGSGRLAPARSTVSTP
jgi:cell wall-associated NlpC family hydrolase